MSNISTDQVTTAVLLAAGTGSRLQPLTNDAPKCLSEINGIPILERLIDNLCHHGFRHLIIVVGYLDHHVRDFLDGLTAEITIEYVMNPDYSTTNNLYSLWLARTAIQDPFLLVESDVVFDACLLEEMLQPDKIAISAMQCWMNGTTVTVDPFQNVSAFQIGACDAPDEVTHKTVNMYSFTMASWSRVADRLSEHVAAGQINEYYETVFAEMVADGSLSLEAVAFDGGRWYEVDTLEDLYKAELIFPGNLVE
jgi:choline kinase